MRYVFTLALQKKLAISVNSVGTFILRTVGSMDAAAKPTGKYLRRVRKMKVPTELTEIVIFLQR